MASMLNLNDDLSNNETSMNMILTKLRNFQSHEINCKRTVHGEYHHLFPILKMYEYKFCKYMRMKRSTFEYILSNTESMLMKDWCNFHQQPILPEERLVVTIRFLVTGSSYSDLAFAFRMGESTICIIIKQIMNVIWDVLYVVHMAMPTVNDFERIAKEFFQRWNFPHCCGAIDGRHIRIKNPAKMGTKYYNYKKFFSIVLQAVVDANYKFIAIDVGGYGSQHDATTFRASTLYSLLQEGKLKLLDENALPNSETILPYFFVGDGAYPLLNFLIKPYPGKKLSAEQENFNKRLSRVLIVVKCAFGIMSKKWQIFFKTINQTPETVEMIVKTACILHNVIIDLEACNSNDNFSKPSDKDTEALLEIENDLNDDSQINLEDTDNNFRKEIREELMKYILKNPLL